MPLSTDSPTHLTGPVAAGPQRLLALAMNTNAGWEATLDGAALTPVVVDGFRQGFVLPAGASGRVDVTFAPDAPYRLALGAGFVLALLLLVAAVVPDRSRRVDPPAGDPGPGARPVLVAGGTLLFALVVAGPWAALAAGLALVALRLRRTDADWPVALAVVVLLGAAGCWSPSPSTAGRTQPWVEATVTLAVIAAGVLAGAAPVVPPSASRGVRRRRGSATPGTG